MNITIVGAGNIGTQFAVHCAEKGHGVTLWTSKPEKICNELFIVDENDDIIHRGIIELATNDAECAFKNTDIVFVTMPAFCMEKAASVIEPFADSGMKIALIPGTGGGEWAFRNCILKGATVFGLQRVPSVARLVEYGKTVRATGYRPKLHVAAIPSEKTDECALLVEEIFEITCGRLPNYLSLTLTPSNPILHTTRLRTIFADYEQGKFYKQIPLFYEEWSDESSELLFKCDKEVQDLCHALVQFDLTGVRSLKEHYESYTPQQLTQKIRSITGFKGLTTPSVKMPLGYVPDLHSRYFVADFSYGLEILVQLADLVSVAVPNMKSTLEWYNNISIEKDKFCFARYGVKNLKDVLNFYML